MRGATYVRDSANPHGPRLARLHRVCSSGAGEEQQALAAQFAEQCCMAELGEAVLWSTSDQEDVSSSRLPKERQALAIIQEQRRCIRVARAIFQVAAPR